MDIPESIYAINKQVIIVNIIMAIMTVWRLHFYLFVKSWAQVSRTLDIYAGPTILTHILMLTLV